MEILRVASCRRVIVAPPPTLYYRFTKFFVRLCVNYCFPINSFSSVLSYRQNFNTAMWVFMFNYNLRTLPSIYLLDKKIHVPRWSLQKLLQNPKNTTKVSHTSLRVFLLAIPMTQTPQKATPEHLKNGEVASAGFARRYHSWHVAPRSLLRKVFH